MGKKVNTETSAKPAGAPSPTKKGADSPKPSHISGQTSKESKGSSAPTTPLSLVTWISLEHKKPRTCDNILFTDGKNVWAGWLETYDPGEDLLFCDALDKEWPENITHWAELPLPPKQKG